MRLVAHRLARMRAVRLVAHRLARMRACEACGASFSTHEGREVCGASFSTHEGLVHHNVESHGSALGEQIRQSGEIQKQRAEE